jgi:hypothetical protein
MHAILIIDLSTGTVAATIHTDTSGQATTTLHPSAQPARLLRVLAEAELPLEEMIRGSLITSPVSTPPTTPEVAL